MKICILSRPILAESMSKSKVKKCCGQIDIDPFRVIGLETFFVFKSTLLLQIRIKDVVMYFGAEENQAHRCDPYGPAAKRFRINLYFLSAPSTITMGLGQ